MNKLGIAVSKNLKKGKIIRQCKQIKQEVQLQWTPGI